MSASVKPLSVDAVLLEASRLTFSAQGLPSPAQKLPLPAQELLQAELRVHHDTGDKLNKVLNRKYKLLLDKIAKLRMEEEEKNASAADLVEEKEEQ